MSSMMSARVTFAESRRRSGCVTRGNSWTMFTRRLLCWAGPITGPLLTDYWLLLTDHWSLLTDHWLLLTDH